MAKSPDHYWYWTFKRDLVNAGLGAVAKNLEDIEDRIRYEVNKLAIETQAELDKNYDKLVPFLRPCHKKQGKSLSVARPSF